MADTWCPNCAREVRTVTVTPVYAWVVGFLAFVVSIALMIGAFTVIGTVVLAAKHVSPAEAETIGYAMTQSIGPLGPTVAALIIGGIVVHAQRRRICLSCRSKLPQARRTARRPLDAGPTG